MSTEPTDLADRLGALTLRDERRLRRRLSGVRRRRPAGREAALAEIAGEVAAAEQRVARRRAGVPAVRYPAALPVSARRDDLLAAIRDHQVVIVAGETGSGKTTQLPKLCLELGRGVRGMIGHTQPRRLAARAVADRIAEELATPLGEAVGYQVRFADHVGDDTLVKVMTDGILLAEIQHDRDLLQYDTVIIDEAHERSLNIDFLLGYLKQLLPRRPDLKLVITSATIDPQRFSRHFDDAPVVEVSGRTYPVEVRYRPLLDDRDDRYLPEDGDSRGDPAGTAADGVRDQTQAVCDAVAELRAEGPGDILVFLSGEREIRDTADALRRLDLPQTEVLPLYARLSAAEQHRVFAQHPGRRIILATNVAETSLTVPGIRYVIDPGTARISRYGHRTKVQRLPIEPISRASADQRKGRCGRLSDGICIRLYAEEDFLGRPEFTDPEILRTGLAGVILAMTALGLGDVEAFPFVDPPDRRSIRDGVQLLEEFGALEPAGPGPGRRLTRLGRRLAQLPVDPRLARMVLEAEANGCVHEVVVIAAALSIQDPRERPADRQQAADEKHARFAADGSDFLAYLNLWRYVQEQQAALSSNQFRRLCRAEFLHHLRIREWQDLVTQLRRVVRQLGIAYSHGPDDPRAVHRSLLAGLLSHIGVKDVDKPEYLGARGARFAVFPGSTLFKKPPRWVVAAELVETSRLWARVVARIEPEWVERVAGDLVQRTYSEPRWDRERGAVLASEKVTLYGVPLVSGRTVTFGRIDPALSRELFIRHALVEGDWDTRHAFFHDNRALLERVGELEHRARRRDIVVGDDVLFDFYDARVGAEVVSARHFDTWWKAARRERPDLLTWTPSLLVNPDAGGVSEQDYPSVWTHGGLQLPLTYQFEPGDTADGVTVHIPLGVLDQVAGAGFDWQVPGLREDLVTALIRSLPKAIRRSLVPAPNWARTVLPRLTPRQEPLVDALGRELLRMTAIDIPHPAWDFDRVPSYLRMTFRVEDADGRPLAEGKDLDALRRTLAGRVRRAIAQAADGVERTGLTGWTIGPLPTTVQRTWAGHEVTGFPALVDEGGTVAVRVLRSEAGQRRAMWTGTRRLLRLVTPSPVKAVVRQLDSATKLALVHNPHGGVPALLDDCVDCAVDRLLAEHGGPVRDEEEFGRLAERVRADLVSAVLDVVTAVRPVLLAWHEARHRLAGLDAPAYAAAVADVRRQLDGLVHPGFVTAAGRRRLPDLLRYLRAVERRLERLPADPARDRARMLAVQEVAQTYDELLAGLPPDGPAREAAGRLRWMIEELRVSEFAQTLGTPYPVSAKRIYRAMDELPG